MDTTQARAMRDTMNAMRERGDTAGIRAMRERMRAAGGGQFGGRGRGQGGPGAASGEINLRPAEAPPGGGQAFGGGRGGFGGFRAGPPVAEGDYLVTITAGGATMKRVVHVERIGTIPEDSGFGGSSDEDDGEEDEGGSSGSR
jgi:hypothetical protein